ncbi:hypothetical protein NDU88_008228 [Pleurodeles waltl]|uniref:Uncharacterized protein n=1 Tax=Pleurodeles waltl TaxID=8319 RepID=A0AAV7NVF1_PLEWA|nr:hypothetical protein NDU88_008228 [Pleurodeles waltl]
MRVSKEAAFTSRGSVKHASRTSYSRNGAGGVPAPRESPIRNRREKKKIQHRTDRGQKETTSDPPKPQCGQRRTTSDPAINRVALNSLTASG